MFGGVYPGQIYPAGTPVYGPVVLFGHIGVTTLTGLAPVRRLIGFAKTAAMLVQTRRATGLNPKRTVKEI